MSKPDDIEDLQLQSDAADQVRGGPAGPSGPPSGGGSSPKPSGGTRGGTSSTGGLDTGTSSGLKESHES